MNVAVKMHTVACDNCLSKFSTEDFCAWHDADEARYQAEESGWHHESNKGGDDKHYCPDCWEYNDEDELVTIMNTEETTNLPNIELVSEKVHEAWMVTKSAQGFHSPAMCNSHNKKSYYDAGWLDQERFQDAGLHPMSFKWCDKCHPCLYPYNELSEKDKDLDRSTVAAVYAAIEAASPAIGTP